MWPRGDAVQASGLFILFQEKGGRGCFVLGLRRGLTGIVVALTGTLAAVPAFAQDPTTDTGDTAWMIVATAIVLMMTLPGLALFYGGMVRKMNVLTIMMQSFATCCLVSIIWMVLGYSLAFSEGSPYVGGLSNLFLKNLTVGSISGTIPESVFMLFQMTFAIITPALISSCEASDLRASSMTEALTPPLPTRTIGERGCARPLRYCFCFPVRTLITSPLPHASETSLSPRSR